MKRTIELLTSKQIMEAFLAGEKLAHEEYYNGYSNDLTKDCEHYLYLDESGFICEEDGAGAKSDRVAQITMRHNKKWWIVK